MLLWDGTVNLAKIPQGKGKRAQIRYLSDEQLPHSVLFISNQIIAFGETLSFNTFVQPHEKEGFHLEEEEKKRNSRTCVATP